jgi:hypothetical protein
MANGRLGAEAVQHGAEDLVVVEAVDQASSMSDFVGDGAVDDALVQVGGAQIPRSCRRT